MARRVELPWLPATDEYLSDDALDSLIGKVVPLTILDRPLGNLTVTGWHRHGAGAVLVCDCDDVLDVFFGSQLTAHTSRES